MSAPGTTPSTDPAPTYNATQAASPDFLTTLQNDLTENPWIFVAGLSGVALLLYIVSSPPKKKTVSSERKRSRSITIRD